MIAIKKTSITMSHLSKEFRAKHLSFWRQKKLMRRGVFSHRNVQVG